MELESRAQVAYAWVAAGAAPSSVSQLDQFESSEHSLSDIFFVTGETRARSMLFGRRDRVLERVVGNKGKRRVNLFLRAINQPRGLH